jgi:hypothetical protein
MQKMLVQMDNMLYLKNLKTQLFSRKATQGDLRTGVHTHVLK